MATAGPRQAGRDPAKIEVTSLLPASVGDTREAALAALRPGLAFYAGFFPRYNRMLAQYGFAAEAAALADAWMRGDREAAEGSVSDPLIDATSVAGTPKRCRARVEAYRQSGIDVPILSPFARGPDADVTSDVIWIAGEGTAGPVRPRNADIIRGAL